MNRGNILAAVAGVAVLAAGIALVIAVATASSDQFGRVAVPGVTTMVVEDGEVEVFYAERGQPDSLSPPSDLQIRITDPQGVAIELRRSSGTQLSSPSGTAVKIGEITGPGDVPLTVETQGGFGRPRPEVTLGRDPFEVASESIGSVLGSPITYVALFAFAWILFLGGIVGRFMGRILRGGHDPEGTVRDPGVNPESEPVAVREAELESTDDVGIDFSTGKPYKADR